MENGYDMRSGLRKMHLWRTSHLGTYIFGARYYTNDRERMEGQVMAERNLENITVTMTKEEKKAIKQAALDNDVSVSALIRLWLEKYQAEKEQSK